MQPHEEDAIEKCKVILNEHFKAFVLTAVGETCTGTYVSTEWAKYSDRIKECQSFTMGIQDKISKIEEKWQTHQG